MAATGCYYSLQWAKARVEELRTKYARATEDVLEALGISGRELAYLLASRNSAYPEIRTLIHDRARGALEGYSGTAKARWERFIRQTLPKIKPTSDFQGLTEVKIGFSLEKQSLKQGSLAFEDTTALPGLRSPRVQGSFSRLPKGGYGK